MCGVSSSGKSLVLIIEPGCPINKYKKRERERERERRDCTWGGGVEGVEEGEGRGVRWQVGVGMVGKREAEPVLRRRIHVVDERERDGWELVLCVFGNSKNMGFLQTPREREREVNR
jgi:hypothetical protein